MPNLLVLLTRLNLAQDIIVLTECWLSRNPNIPPIDGYNHYATNTNRNQNDGTVVYIRSDIGDVAVSEQVFTDANCLKINIGNDTCILAIYRSPSVKDLTSFLNSLDHLLTTICSFKNIIIIGDINIDITEGRLDSGATDYLNLLASHGLLPAHSLVTHDKTSLDHVILKTTHKAITMVIQSSVTDHNAVMLALAQMRTSHTVKTKRKIDYSKLDQCIKTIDFSCIYSSGNANSACEFLLNSLSEAIRSSSKICTVPHRLKIIKPWITPGILRCMKNRDRMYRKHKNNPDNETLQITFKRYRNFCNSLLKKLKKQYEKNILIEAKSNPKKLWSAIKEVAHIAKKNSSTAHDLLKLGSSPDISVSEVNTFFVNVGKNLAEKVAGQSNNYKTTETNSVNSLVLLETDEREVELVVNSLRSDCAVGVDGISASVIKQYKDILIRPITYLINVCLSTGVFPDLLKQALVHPIHKSGDRNRVTNYRPISVLPVVSKILEKIINNCLKNYLEKNNLLSDRQYGFRNDRSTDDAVHDLTNHIVTSLDKREKCVAIFLDLAKAFDTVSIPRLCTKLEKLGIRDRQLELFKSYLTGRTQRVKIGEWISSELPVDYGVPQGSILGPTLFLSYVNDMCNININNGKLVAFADDTALIFTARTWAQAFEAAQAGFYKVSRWLSNNLLSLNVEKTKFLTFCIKSPKGLDHSRYKIFAHNHELNDLNCDCPRIERSPNIRYLGVILDDKLNFRAHIANLSGRVRKLIYVFKHLRHVAEPLVLKSVYYALCQSLLGYCILTWGGSSKTILINLERAQRAVLKVCTFKPYRFSTKDLYQFCEVLTVRQLFIRQIILRQHAASRELVQSSASTRHRRVNIIPCGITCKTSFGQKFYYFLGRYLYNKINNNLEVDATSYYDCKTKVTNWLLQLTYEETENLLYIAK